jgi:PAB-dependent poly(A)-specific ribonuclease subunit 2
MLYCLPCVIVTLLTYNSCVSDLSPLTSRHALVTRRVGYLKLRFFVDRGLIFIGHGLKKDFEIANIVVPRGQIRDTVELWRLPGQRKISLRFLASYLLQKHIQVFSFI